MPDPAEALELESRKRIYEHVRSHAGAHMREIGRDLALPMGTLEYHLHYLVKVGLLSLREDGRYTRYFVVGDLGRREKDILAVLRQKMPRQIAAFLLLHPGSSHATILAQFHVSASTLSFHLKKLVAAQIAAVEKQGRENLYRVVDAENVSKVLIAHRASFVDDVVDRFAEVWLSLEPREGAEPSAERDAGGTGGTPEDAGQAPPGPGNALLVFATRFLSAAFLRPSGA
ncbi:MAG: winged helix-turn-helix transcriptional regulator [Thermoplasmatota archaeon]